MKGRWHFSLGRACYEGHMDGETWAWLCEQHFIRDSRTAQNYARRYRLRWGLPKFPRRWGRTLACRVCGKRAVRAEARHGRCPACKAYYTSTGTERPRRLWAPQPQHCGNCGVDVGISQRVRPRCEACWQYRHRTGRERPARLWRNREAA